MTSEKGVWLLLLSTVRKADWREMLQKVTNKKKLQNLKTHCRGSLPLIRLHFLKVPQLPWAISWEKNIQILASMENLNHNTLGWLPGLQNKWIKVKKQNKSNSNPLRGCKYQGTLADLSDKGTYKKWLILRLHLFLLSSMSFKSHSVLALISPMPSLQIAMVVLPPRRGRTRTAGHHPTWKLFLRCFPKYALCLIQIEFILVFTSSALVSCSFRGGLIDAL